DAARDERLARAAAISQEKIHTLAEFWPLAGALLDGLNDDPKARERWLGADGLATLADVRSALAEAERFDEHGVRAALEAIGARSTGNGRMQATASTAKAKLKPKPVLGGPSDDGARRPGAAVQPAGERHQNEGHGRRLTMAFEALEAFPALAESRDRLLTVI